MNWERQRKKYCKEHCLYGCAWHLLILHLTILEAAFYSLAFNPCDSLEITANGYFWQVYLDQVLNEALCIKIVGFSLLSKSLVLKFFLFFWVLYYWACVSTFIFGQTSTQFVWASLHYNLCEMIFAIIRPDPPCRYGHFHAPSSHGKNLKFCRKILKCL